MGGKNPPQYSQYVLCCDPGLNRTAAQVRMFFMARRHYLYMGNYFKSHSPIIWQLLYRVRFCAPTEFTRFHKRAIQILRHDGKQAILYITWMHVEQRQFVPKAGEFSTGPSHNSRTMCRDVNLNEI